MHRTCATICRMARTYRAEAPCRAAGRDPAPDRRGRGGAASRRWARARTTVSAIAERAGRAAPHFLPALPGRAQPRAWPARAVTNAIRSPTRAPSARWPEARPGSARASGKRYAYYEANAEAMAPIMRDAAVDPLTRELVDVHTAPRLEATQAILAAPFAARGARRRRLDAALWRFRWTSTPGRRCARRTPWRSPCEASAHSSPTRSAVPVSLRRTGAARSASAARCCRSRGAHGRR